MYQSRNNMGKQPCTVKSNHSGSSRMTCYLSKPLIVGYMSVDGMRNYHSDVSQLKFLNTIPEDPIQFDLNHNINAAVKRTTDNNDEKITILLQFLLDQYARLKCVINKSTFISYRRTLISIMCSAYGVNEPLRIAGSFFNGSIYLSSLETEGEKMRKQTLSHQEKKMCAWGYKFEQYLLSDLPNIPPDIQKPVVENEEFSLYYVAQLGDKQLLYGAQIDGLLSTNNVVPNPPETTNVDTNIGYLQRNVFLELKTNRIVQNFKQERSFKRYKLMRCWCSCYLADLKGLIVGYRNDDGIIEKLQWFETHEIASHCKDDWNPQNLIDYLDYFLSYIRRCFQNYNYLGPITLKFELDRNGRIQVENMDDDLFLPKWYTEQINAKPQ